MRCSCKTMTPGMPRDTTFPFRGGTIPLAAESCVCSIGEIRIGYVDLGLNDANDAEFGAARLVLSPALWNQVVCLQAFPDGAAAVVNVPHFP